MRYLISACTAFTLTVGSVDAFAQERSIGADLRPATVVAERLALEESAAQRSDSVKEGAITGAVVGGAAMGAFMIMLIRNVGCVAEKTPCGREIAIASLMTAGAAGAGALIGAGIDAAVHDQKTGFRTKSGVMPIVSRKRNGVAVVVKW